LAHGILAFHQDAALAVVTVTKRRQLSYQLVVWGYGDAAQGEKFPQPPEALGPKVGKQVVLAGAAGNVDSLYPVALLLQPVHFVPYAIDRGVSPNLAATIFGVMLGLNVFGALGTGLLADRFGRKNLLALVYFLRGSGYMILLLPGLLGWTLLSGNLGLWLFALVTGFSWWATLPLTSSLTADVYGLRTLGTISGVSFAFHQIGAAASVLFAAVLYDLTGSYTIPFLIAGFLLFPAALSAFTIKERKYSVRYQPTTPAPSGAAAGAGN